MLLGVFHVVAIILCTARLVHLWRPSVGLSSFRYRMLGTARAVQLGASGVAAACAFIVLFQVNGRVGGRAVDGLAYGGIAPYESGGRLCSEAAVILVVTARLFSSSPCSKRSSQLAKAVAQRSHEIAQAWQPRSHSNVADLQIVT